MASEFVYKGFYREIPKWLDTVLIGPIEKGKRFNVSEMRKNCSVVVIMNQLAITWYAGANVGVFVVCLLLIAEQIAHDTPDTGMLTNSEVLIYPWYGIAI